MSNYDIKGGNFANCRFGDVSAITESELLLQEAPPRRLESINPQCSSPRRLFFSYADQDQASVTTLETSLALLKRQGIIVNWHKDRLDAGSVIATEVDRQLQDADIILLLISPDFIEQCFDFIERAMQRHRAGSAIVIPIFLRPTFVAGTSFDELASLPKNRKPITTWARPDEAWLDVVQGIQQAVVSR